MLTRKWYSGTLRTLQHLGRGQTCRVNALACVATINIKHLFAKRELLHTMAKEEEVGISCYLASTPGFKAILKERYSDFIVNEVDREGNVVHLTCLDPPRQEATISTGPENDVDSESKEDSTNNEKGVVKVVEYEPQLQIFKGISNEGDVQLLQEILTKVSEGGEAQLSPVVLSPDADKAHRTVIHNFFKTHLPFLVTDTVDGPDSFSKCVRIRYCQQDKSNSKTKRDRRGNWPRNKRPKFEGPAFDRRGLEEAWPADRGKFLRFHLYKENKDTQDALMVLARALHIKTKSFGMAGTKDKRAITTQRVTVFKQSAAKMASLNKRLYGIRVGDFCYVNEGLVLGQLSGNRFTITLRGVDAENSVIEKAAEYLKRDGFINYFGLQRFGTNSIPTYAIGAALLRGDWKTAADLILQPREGDILTQIPQRKTVGAVKETFQVSIVEADSLFKLDSRNIFFASRKKTLTNMAQREDIKEAREYYMKTKDEDGALHRLPLYLVAERQLLNGLKKCRTNVLSAFYNIPRTMRMMYIHSYQSYLWNHAASKRIQLYGSRDVVEGDLVYCEDGNGELANVMVSTVNDLPEEDTDGPETFVNEDVLEVLVPEVLSKVKVVTDEDVASGRYSIKDVVLPLPGSKTLLPTNDVANVYKELASKDSVDLKDCSHNVKEFSLLHVSGGYRRLVEVPKDFDWKVLKYTDPSQNLAESDLDRILRGSKVDKKTDVKEETEKKVVSETNHQDESVVGEQTAILLSLTLPTSCYATMAIREILKIPTSVEYHRALSTEHAK